MTPDEGLQHQWILEGNFNRVRSRAKTTVKKTSDTSTSADRQANSKSGKQKPFPMMLEGKAAQKSTKKSVKSHFHFPAHQRKSAQKAT